MVAVMATLSVKAQIVKNLEYPRGHFGIRAAYTSNTYTLDRGYDEAFDTEISETAEYYQQLDEMSVEEIVENYKTFNENNE